MSYTSSSVKEFILFILKNNIIPSDCLQIIYQNIINDIINTYNYFNIYVYKPSMFELEILYINNFNFINDYIYHFTQNNYVDGILFLKKHNIIDYLYLYDNINNLLVSCCNVGNLDMFDLLYNLYREYIINNNWLNDSIYYIIKNNYNHFIDWFDKHNYIIYCNKLYKVFEDEDINFIINANKLNIHIGYSPILKLINYITFNIYHNIEFIDTLYEYLIKTNQIYLDEFNNTIDYIIKICINSGKKNIFNWIESKGIIYSLDEYYNNKTILLKILENNNCLYNIDNIEYDYYNDNIDNIDNIIIKKKIINPCINMPFRRKNKKYNSKLIIKNIDIKPIKKNININPIKNKPINNKPIKKTKNNFRY